MTLFMMIPFAMTSQTLKSQDMEPFKIETSDDVLQDLRTRLSMTRWTDNPEGDGWSYGTNANYLKELVTYWQKEYDWRKQEAMLNSLPQFKTEIDGVEIHLCM